MNIELMQTFVAKLYTSKDFLALFQHAPNKAFDLMLLPAAERSFFLTVDNQRIEKIHQIVMEKQHRMLKSSFPIFFIFYQKKFEYFVEAFFRLNKNYSSSCDGKLRQASDFHDFCVHRLSLEPKTEQLFLADLVRFEYLYLKIGNRNVPRVYSYLPGNEKIDSHTRFFVHEYVHLEDFNFPILEIIQNLEDNRDYQLEKNKSSLLFVPNPGPVPKLVPVSPRHRCLLPYFDGSTTFEKLTLLLAKQEPPEVLKELPHALGFLKSNQILMLL